MVASVGKKLQQARIGKQLSIEEAARVTRIRPDKLIDLEEDNYANFPSMSYAKGFLLLYARFLGVDVHEFAESLHAPNPVSTDDYEYLNAASSGPPSPPNRRPYYFSPRREHTVLPVIVIGFLIGAVCLGSYLYVTFLRLGPDMGENNELASPGASPAISTLPSGRPVATPLPVAPAPAPVLRSSPPAMAAPTPAAQASPAPSTAVVPLSSPAETFDPSRQIRRAVPVFPSPPRHAAASSATPDTPDLSAVAPVSAPADLKQVSIRPLRKTWVTIRKDVADSPPFFEDWLYPGDAPLKLKGRKFWIKVQDPSTIQVTQDGEPLPAGQGDIQIE